MIPTIIFFCINVYRVLINQISIILLPKYIECSIFKQLLKATLFMQKILLISFMICLLYYFLHNSGPRPLSKQWGILFLWARKGYFGVFQLWNARKFTRKARLKVCGKLFHLVFDSKKKFTFQPNFNCAVAYCFLCI